jgi:FkbM family methyltransferase
MNIPDVFNKWNIRPKGLIHIGAHMCQERALYHRSGIDDSKVIWIEGNVMVYRRFKFMLQDAGVHTVRYYHGLIADEKRDVEFHLCDWEEAGSIYEIQKASNPDLTEISTYKAQTISLPEFLTENSLKAEDYDFLVMDIQGAELDALKGLETIINNFKHIYLEVSFKELYKGAPLYPEVRNWLETRGYKLMDISSDTASWGDALFVRSDV